MATRFVNVDRKTPMLLPPDLRDWVPEDDLVHFVIEAVEAVEPSRFHVNERGSGSAQYPPRMMLALLIYCYANGVFGSRRIERLTYRDVAVRYLTGDTHPDHDTICRFRRSNEEAIARCFVEVLKLARELKLLKLGTISIDGTHIRANASKDKNVTYKRAQELERQLQGDIAELMKRAEAADKADNEEGRKLPKQIARREALKDKIEKARKKLEEQARQQAEAQRPAYEEKLERHRDRNGRGRAPKPPSQKPEQDKQVNLTDAESSLMRKNKRAGYTQSYNAQASVDADGSQLIVGCSVSTCASDANELESGIESVPEEVGKVDRVLADAGYVNGEAFERIEKRKIDLYVSVDREDTGSERKYEFRPNRPKAQKKLTDARLLAMRAKLKEQAGKEIYAKRKHTVEPVFGIIKSVLGFRQFLLRGKRKARAEWELVCLAYNLKRLHNLALQPQKA